MDLSLVFPHQLFEHHPALQPGRAVALIEDPLLFGTDPRWPIQVHRQRLLLHRASMNAYAEMLQAKGFTVLRVLQGQAASTAEILGDLLEQGYRAFHLADPVDPQNQQPALVKKSRIVQQVIVSQGRLAQSPQQEPRRVPPTHLMMKMLTTKARFQNLQQEEKNR